MMVVMIMNSVLSAEIVPQNLIDLFLADVDS